jgi:nucleoside-diphosphate-sugar epimerase
MVESTQLPLVVITGVTGYLGSQVLNEFLRGEGRGRYRIRATVRDHTNLRKLEPLRSYFGDDYSKIEFVSASLTDKAQIEAAIYGADYVVHTASPVGSNPNNPQDMIRPAVDGVRFVMEAAHKNNVKRVVITSSIAAIFGVEETNNTFTYDESHWTAQ